MRHSKVFSRVLQLSEVFRKFWDNFGQRTFSVLFGSWIHRAGWRYPARWSAYQIARKQGRMSRLTIICDIARWQILHDFRETYKTENAFILTFIPINKRNSIMRQILRKILSRDICRCQSLCSATKTFICAIKQLSHQYHKILALCNIKEELASSFSMNIARSQYFVVLMQ